MATSDKPVTTSFTQWVSRVIGYSSEYDSINWSANRVIGSPKVYPQHGDLAGAWAPQNIDENQYLELGFEEPVFVSEIHIFETMNAGGIKNISVFSPQRTWESVYSTEQVQVLRTSRDFSPPIRETGYKTNAVRLDIDCSVCGSWVEIDAVQLIGRKFNIAASPSMDQLADDLSKLFNQPLYSDVTFDVDGTLIFAHRNILSARSSYFRALFEDQHSSKENLKQAVPILDASLDGFHGVLFYLYTNRVPQNFSSCQLIDVWRAADFYILDGLKAVVSQAVANRMDNDNVVDVYTKVCRDLPVIDDIRDMCQEYMTTNMATVSRTERFKQISKDLMLEIIQLCTARMSLK